MTMKLTRPLIHFDIESTGVDVAKDRIVQIAFKKVLPDGTSEIKQTLINPEMPIPAGATEIHHITDEMVKDAPTFKQISKSLVAFLDGCDYAGYNILGFDIPLLNEELLRVGLDLPKGLFIDAFNIFRKKEERSLTAALKFYCGKEMEGAHDAMNDVNASEAVLLAQLERYTDIGESMEEIAKFSAMREMVDYAGWFAKNDDGDYIYARGKNKDRRVKDDPGFARWMYQQSFLTRDTMKWTEEILQSLNPQSTIF